MNEKAEPTEQAEIPTASIEVEPQEDIMAKLESYKKVNILEI